MAENAPFNHIQHFILKATKTYPKSRKRCAGLVLHFK
jgi:hypothetical protein